MTIDTSVDSSVGIVTSLLIKTVDDSLFSLITSQLISLLELKSDSLIFLVFLFLMKIKEKRITLKITIIHPITIINLVINDGLLFSYRFISSSIYLYKYYK